MRISAREACVKPHLRTRSDIKVFTLHGKHNANLKYEKNVGRWQLYYLFSSITKNTERWIRAMGVYQPVCTRRVNNFLNYSEKYLN